MDKSIKSFLFLLQLLILSAAAVLAAFGYIYRHSSVNTYNNILLILIVLTIIITAVFILGMLAILHTYRKECINARFTWVVRTALKMTLPLVTLISGFLKVGKDEVMGFYIKVNNILVESCKKRYPPEEILVLLPHCLQNSNCNHKITNDIGNCRRCGKCCIGDIARLAEEMGIKVMVVTGGTAARNIVGRSKPGIILSVACERDLAAGIADVNYIPVLGIVNERPNGPCNNTRVDMDILKQRLNETIMSLDGDRR